MTEMYDPDDALNRSPSPEPQVIDYSVVKSPEHYIPTRSPSPENDPSETPRKSSRDREGPDPSSLAGAMLIHAIAPDRPDLFRFELQQGSREREVTIPAEKGSDIKGDRETKIAQETLAILQDPVQHSPGRSPSPEQPRDKDEQGPVDFNPSDFNSKEEADNISGELEQHVVVSEEVEKLRKHSPRPEEQSHYESTSSEIIPRHKSNATSPNLREFEIPPSDRPATEALPRLQPLPLSTSPNLSESSQTLPSLQSTLGTQLKKSLMNDQTSAVKVSQQSYPPVPASSPPQKQHTSTNQESQSSVPYLPPQIPPAYSQATPPSAKDMSSLSPPSRPGGPHPYWRAHPKSESSFVTSPLDPGSVGSQMGNSPSTGYPTPADHMTPNETDRPNTVNNLPQPNGPLTSSGFKCTYPGCMTPPFQTQYLLK